MMRAAGSHHAADRADTRTADSTCQAAFRRLAVFAGTFSLEAAEAVVPAPGDVTIPVLDGITALIDHSLLKQQEEEGPELHLYLLEFIREYALACLGAGDELEQARHAHARYYLALAERAEPALVGAAQALWMHQLEREVENIRTALHWLFERHEYDAALRLPTALRQFWIRRERLYEGRSLLEQALEASREDAGEHHTQVRAQALQAAGILAYFLGDLEHAPVYLETSVRMFQQLEDKPGIALSLHYLGTIAYIRGEVNAGLALMEQGLAHSREIGATNTSAEILLMMGAAALFRGEYGQAQQLLAESQTLYTAGEDVWGGAFALHFLGMIVFAQGDNLRARSLSEQSLASFRKLGMPWPATEVLVLLAREALALGEEDEASALLEEALFLARKRANTDEVVRVLCGLGQLARRQGNLTEARALCEEGITRIQGRTVLPRLKWVVALCLEELGAIAMAQDQAPWAVQLFAAAATARGAHGYYDSLGLEQPAYERTLAEARAQLGEKAYAAAWAAGKQMTPQQALTAAARIPLEEDVQALPAAMPQAQPAPAKSAPLTRRESEVLRLLAQGLSNKQIAEQLVLSPFTVGTHVETIYGKLGVSSRSAATRFAVEHHLV
jgi:ATP/maltotriose-dependent transcriptional regulator MalT